MLGIAGQLMAAGAAGAADATPVPPAGPPTNVSHYEYGGLTVGVQWTNGDVTATTQLGKSTVDQTPPTGLDAQVGPGVTFYETGESGEIVDAAEWWWWVRHIRDGLTTAWVEPTNGVAVPVDPPPAGGGAGTGGGDPGEEEV